MKAIMTKYLGPTNHRGSRIKAWDCDGNSVTVSYDHASPMPHADAAVKLCEKMGWKGEMIQGAVEDGYVHVFTGEGEDADRPYVRDGGFFLS